MEGFEAWTHPVTAQDLTSVAQPCHGPLGDSWISGSTEYFVVLVRFAAVCMADNVGTVEMLF